MSACFGKHLNRMVLAFLSFYNELELFEVDGVSPSR